MKKYVDLKREERVFSVGDWVYLRLQPYQELSMAQHKNTKLASRFYGPFQVVDKIGVVAYKL